MNVAKYIRKVKGWTGDARLYKLSDGIEFDKDWDVHNTPSRKTNYVIVSATIAMYSGSETYIFAANKDGDVLSWSELGGSYRGGLSHEMALRNAGFCIEE